MAFGARHPAWESFDTWRDRHPDTTRTCRPGQPTPPCSSTPAAPGLPKGAELTNANFAWMLPLWTRTWLLAPGVPNLVCLPMFHIGGAGWGIAGLFSGAANHVMREFVPVEILQTVEREKPQVMLLVPAMILFPVQSPQIRETDLSSLRLIVYGAAPIPADLLRQAMGIFPCGFQQVYGLTETTGAITLLPPDDHDPADVKKLLSCGYAQEGGAAHRRRRRQGQGDGPGRRDRRALAADHGRLLEPARRHPARHPGRLVLHRRRGLPRRQGLSYIYDRVKDMIVSGGENIYPAEVESVVRPSRRRRRRRDRRARRARARR